MPSAISPRVGRSNDDPMNASQRVLRVFLASTASDLEAYRERLRETILMLGHRPEAMESMPAGGHAPAPECVARAAAADALVVVAAHRYGYVPPVERGGDGERSITWLEVDAARQAGKPVFAFLVDSAAPWDQEREQDRLLKEHDRAQEIGHAVRRLQEFRAWLADHFMADFFTGVDDLAARVTAALSRALPAAAPEPARAWRPLVMHPLQPARHFHGRGALVKELTAWLRSPASPTRVVSVVAVGGTGKTALVQRVLAAAGEEREGGLLVWSFYDDPRTEEFLRVACEYFTGQADAPVGQRLERLQRALAEGPPHVLVLDGLERVQAGGQGGRLRGTLDDPQAKRLLRFAAAGVSHARVLLTSRYPVVDLDQWRGAGHRSIRLVDLDAPAARAVLREWGVRGSDRVLDRLARSVHRHALTVAVLGSYLGNFCGGDPARAPTFHPGSGAANDLDSSRLARVLNEYALALDPAERALMARIAAFPRGVNTAILGYLLDEGGRVAGGLGDTRLEAVLKRLRDLGLVFAYPAASARPYIPLFVYGGAGQEKADPARAPDRAAGADLNYTAHPFLREHFEEMLDVQKRELHEVVRARLAPGLAARPKQYPTEPGDLDGYERLVEHTRMAGRDADAFELYWYGMGNYGHLGKWLGENMRGLRVVSGFARDGSVAEVSRNLADDQRGLLLGNWGLYAKNLGELDTARQAFALSMEIWEARHDAGNCSAILQDVADAEILAGRLAAALQAANGALEHADAAGDPARQAQAHGYLGMVMALLGNVRAARDHFAQASYYQAEGIELLRRLETSRARPAAVPTPRPGVLLSVAGVQEAEFHLLGGRAAQAREQLRVVRWRSQDERSVRIAAICDTLLGHVSLTEDPGAAAEYLAVARAFGTRAGVVEIEIRAMVLAAELGRRRGQLHAARAEAEAALLLADGCGFGRYSIDLRLALARVALDAGDPAQALAASRDALERAAAPECRYAWGEADALHLLGCAHARRGEAAPAGKRLSAALALRERLHHPEVERTRAALDAVSLAGEPIPV